MSDTKNELYFVEFGEEISGEMVALLRLLTLSGKDSKDGNVYSREQLLDNL